MNDSTCVKCFITSTPGRQLGGSTPQHDRPHRARESEPRFERRQKGIGRFSETRRSPVDPHRNHCGLLERSRTVRADSEQKV